MDTTSATRRPDDRMVRAGGARRGRRSALVAALLLLPAAAGSDTPPAPAVPAPAVAAAVAAAARPAPAGDPRLDRVVAGGLDWLARHQDPESGGWSANGFEDCCDGEVCGGPGAPMFDVGVTGLALLAFLAQPDAAETHRALIERGLKRLVGHQDAKTGNLGTAAFGQHTYDHLIATMALVEGLALLGEDSLREPAAHALDYVYATQTAHQGWRYASFHQEMQIHASDTSVTTWALEALLTAQRAGLDVRAQPIEDGLAFVRSMGDDPEAAQQRMQQTLDHSQEELDRLRESYNATEAAMKNDLRRQMDELSDRIVDLKKKLKAKPELTGLVGYYSAKGTSPRLVGKDTIWPAEKTAAMTAAGLLCRYEELARAGASRADELCDRMLDVCMELPPTADDPQRFDAYYWFEASCLFAHPLAPPSQARTWQRKLGETLAALQERMGCARGSFDPKRDPWGEVGGRVYTTAALTIAASAQNSRHALRAFPGS